MFCLSFFGLDVAIFLPTGCVDSCMPNSVVRNFSFCSIGAQNTCFRDFESWQHVYRMTEVGHFVRTVSLDVL